MNNEQISRQYFCVKQECPECLTESSLFIKGPPRTDKYYSYVCSQCNNKVIFFIPGAGIGYEILPSKAQVVSITS